MDTRLLSRGFGDCKYEPEGFERPGVLFVTLILPISTCQSESQ